MTDWHTNITLIYHRTTVEKQKEWQEFCMLNAKYIYIQKQSILYKYQLSHKLQIIRWWLASSWNKYKSIRKVLSDVQHQPPIKEEKCTREQSFTNSGTARFMCSWAICVIHTWLLAVAALGISFQPFTYTKVLNLAQISLSILLCCDDIVKFLQKIPGLQKFWYSVIYTGRDGSRSGLIKVSDKLHFF